MPGRRVFFSFHYEQDVWRAANVRNSGNFDARSAAGWADASLWEATKRRGPTAIRRLIDEGLDRTSVTVVLIGNQTANRDWVNYEIERSIERKNGLIGVRIHTMKDQHGMKTRRGAVPRALADGGFSVYSWDGARLGTWVELAAIDAGKNCLRHQQPGCWKCKLVLRYW